jgi:LmbE family N-acetylglucosaminyl deacetylase
MAECLEKTQLLNSAIVFAPHQDDETLGCGGTIIQKVVAGARVHLCFITDGRRSHRHLMAENELKKLRNKEAMLAAAKLGIRREHVHFLNLKSGELRSQMQKAIPRLKRILSAVKPQQIYVPYRNDSHLEHKLSYRLIVSASEDLSRRMDIYEYPVWYWHHWPWVSLEGNSVKERARQMKHGLAASAMILKHFRTSVYIKNLHDRKHAALAEYKSQTTRLNHDANWPTLSDVAGGQWLNCFFQEREIFMHTTANSTSFSK